MIEIDKSVDDNIIQPFQLESSNLRGREIRLGSVLDDILAAHDYPNPVAHLVAETIVVTLLLSSMLKYDGIFTLQASGDGPVGMLVSDMMTPENVIRGCATYDAERLEASREQLAALAAPEGSQNHLAQYLGKGHMAFTVDQNGGDDRYQGIVDLEGASLVDCVQHYFKQSEQIQTGIKMAVGLRDGKWRAGGIMIQALPEDQVSIKAGAENTGEDDWRRSMILMDSCTEDEFLDVDLDSKLLLFRLFHEEGVRVFDALPVAKGCRSSRERVETMLKTMPDEDIDYMMKEEQVDMVCEFCSTNYVFDSAEIGAIMKARKGD